MVTTSKRAKNTRSSEMRDFLSLERKLNTIQPIKLATVPAAKTPSEPDFEISTEQKPKLETTHKPDTKQPQFPDHQSQQQSARSSAKGAPGKSRFFSKQLTSAQSTKALQAILKRPTTARQSPDHKSQTSSAKQSPLKRRSGVSPQPKTLPSSMADDISSQKSRFGTVTKPHAHV